MKKLTFLAFGMFVKGCGSFIIAGLLPEIGKTIGESLAVTGQGITAFSLAYLISAPLFSMIPSFKSEKTVIQFALLILILGNVLTAISEGLLLFLVARVLAGIGAGVYTPSCVAMTMRLTEASKKGRALSFILAANSAGLVFGIPLGLYLSNHYGWQSTMVYIIGMTVLAFIGISMQTIELETQEASSAFLDRFRLLGDRSVLSLIGVTCFIAVASLGLYSYVAALQKGTPNSLAAMMFAWGLGGFLGSSFVGFFIDRTKRPQLIMTFILVGMTLTFLAIPQTKGIEYLGVLPFLIWGMLGWAITTPQQHTLFQLNEEQGKLLTALNSSALGLGGAMGTAAGGSLIAYGVEAHQLPIFAAGVLFLVLMFQILFVNKIESNMERD